MSILLNRERRQSTIKEKLSHWISALDAFERGATIDALEQFMSAEPSAKNYFNAGMCAMKLHDGDEAVRAFSAALTLDCYLAVARFQRGVCMFIMDDLCAALDDFVGSLLLMRGNATIKYDQLGLAFQLHSSHIIFNIGMCKVKMGDNRGLLDFNSALKEKAAGFDFVRINDAISLGSQAHEHLCPYELSCEVLFRPQDKAIININKINHLGSSKIIAETPQLWEHTARYTYVDKAKTFRESASFKKNSSDKSYNYDSLGCSSTLFQFRQGKLGTARGGSVDFGIEYPSPLSRKGSVSSSLSTNSSRKSHGRRGSVSSIISSSSTNSNSSSNSEGLIKIRCHHNQKDIKLIITPSDTSFESFEERVNAKFGKSMQMEYKDSDGNMISLDGDDAMQDAFNTAHVGKYDIWLC
jgi:tetratricopeptide (TPR) repeat protein